MTHEEFRSAWQNDNIPESATLICKDGTSNKWWKYTISGGTYTTSHGRVGGANGQPTTKPYGKSDLLKKIDEKFRKGYKYQTEEQVSKAVEVAEMLGAQYKIQKIEWVRKGDTNKYEIISEYSPDDYIYAEVINSWSKEQTHIIMNKIEAHTLNDISIIGDTISYSNFGNWAPGNFIDAIKATLQDLLNKIIEVIRMDTIGTRSLLGGTYKISSEAIKTVTSMSSGVSDQVIQKFSSLGTRKLSL